MPRGFAKAAALGALLSVSAVASAQQATPSSATPAQPAEMLSGAMAPYTWFPGHWSCQTTVVSSGATTPGTLTVLVDPLHDVLSQHFVATLAGKPYRSDEILAYDRTKHAYFQKEVDQTGTQILLFSPGAYQASMTYEGVMVPSSGKLYRMRATIAVDAAGSQLHTSTAFWQATTKSWAVQSTGACSKQR